MGQSIRGCCLPARFAGQKLTADQLNGGLRGLVVLAGHCSDEEALKAAAELPLKGLILASIAPSLTATALRIKIPVVVIEGFGNLALKAAAYRLLTTNEKREVFVLADLGMKQGDTTGNYYPASLLEASHFRTSNPILHRSKSTRSSSAAGWDYWYNPGVGRPHCLPRWFAGISG